MVFASLTFLFLFLPSMLLLYYCTPKKGRNGCLLAANLLFYGWGEPSFLIVILFSAVVNFTFGKLIDQFRGNRKIKKYLAVTAVSVDLGLLVVLKYTNFIVTSLKLIPVFAFLPSLHILLPLGISFYTFHVISYIVDVYRGDSPAQKSLIKFSVYISLFPQMIAGPIVRYKQMQNQLDLRSENPSQFASGVRLIVIGLAKKVLIANPMGRLWDAVQASGGQAGFLGAWAGALAFTFQIYFDFGGYSDMARGLGKLFGFELPVNFNYPYTAKSVTDFWRRWHMSLSMWFRDYVYIPLGGSRKGMPKTICNLLIVWILTGFWHGANWNFLIWGLYYFVLLALEKLFLRQRLEHARFGLGHVYTCLCFVIGWMLFSFENFGALGRQLRMMFGFSGFFPSNGIAYRILYLLPLLLAAAFFSQPTAKKIYDRLRNPRLRGIAECLGCVVLTGLSTASLISQSYNPFLYFRF